MELISQPVGTEGSYKVELVEGQIKFTLVHKHASGESSVVLVENAAYFFDKLAAAIPGTLDDAVLGLMKAAVLAMK